jgi:hypothetical protein
LLPYRELDDAFGLTDTRTGESRHLLRGLLCQSVFGRLAGYEDVNDADRLCRDPAMRWVVGDRGITGAAASASQMGRFETKWLSRLENLAALAALPGQWIDKVHQRRPPSIVVLDMDSSESPTSASRRAAPTTATSAAPAITRYSCSTSSAMSERCAPRSGNVHSVDGWRAVLEPMIARYGGIVKRLYFRGDRLSPIPRYTSFWKPRASATRSGCRPTTSCSAGSDTY